jgi:hypothetical protein
MRACLIEGCGRHGLVVVGYSGRDASVIEALHAAVNAPNSFPGGFFWFKRYQDDPHPALRSLMLAAKAKGLDAHIVEVETFDELFADIIRFLPETEKEIGRIAGAKRPRLAKIVPRASDTKIPAIRTNALPIVSYPAICRLVACDIGGSSEVQDAIRKSGLDIIATRARPGVLAFGRDAEIRKTFEPFKIISFDTHAIRLINSPAPPARARCSGTRFFAP